jgi:hypothetical protein
MPILPILLVGAGVIFLVAFLLIYYIYMFKAVGLGKKGLDLTPVIPKRT